MKIVIDIPEEEYNTGQLVHYFGCYSDKLDSVIYNGVPLPEGAEILTKEAYSDLCTRAADVPNFESEEYVEERIKNYDKMLRSGILDCIKESPSVETEKCSHEDIAKAFQFGMALGFGEKHDEMNKVIEEVKKAVTPQPKPGKWIASVDKRGDIVTTVNGYNCSECGEFDVDKDNYCPNCGAKMEGYDFI